MVTVGSVGNDLAKVRESIQRGKPHILTIYAITLPEGTRDKSVVRMAYADITADPKGRCGAGGGSKGREEKECM